jgi:TolA-binding protein
MKQCMTWWKPAAVAACLLVLPCGPTWAQAQPAPKKAEPKAARDAAVDIYAAKSLLKKATALLSMGEKDRGVKMLETVIEQYADTPVRYEAYLALGKYYLDQREHPKAITVLRHLQDLKKPEQEVAGADREMYLEGLYLTGMAYFQMKQYGSAFPILRRITTSYPNTVWANQAYYYVGMCHFQQANWNKAIQALGLVGTFVDPNSPTVSYVEAGRRFFVKIEDSDLPILYRLDKKINVTITTAHGDKETVECIPLSLDSGVFLASIPTEVGKAKPGDGVIQVVGGDTITTTYTDMNTKTGQKDVVRSEKVEVVSTASVNFTMGTYDAKAPAAFIGQPLHVLLQDADLDVSDAADKAQVKIVSRYKVAEDEEKAAGEGLKADLTIEEEEKYKIRDEVTLDLTELGDAPVHTGRFAGFVAIEGFREDQPVNRTDKVLTCAVSDEIVVTFVDELHIGGRSPRIARDSIQVAGEITSKLGTSVNYVPDAVLRARKNLVEATAYLELAKIFASMGLKKGAITKAGDGLERVDAVLKTDSPIPSELKEEAFKLRWELYLTVEDYGKAIATCQLFNRLFPDSPFVDQALMGIGRIRLQNKDFGQARQVFQQVLGLPNSMVKPQAQFMIAESIYNEAKEREEARASQQGETAKPMAGLTDEAVRQYKLCAERYPESMYAGESLGKLVDYYLESRDYPRADDLLEQIFQDYPDGNFLDSMLLKWVYVAYRMGNHQKALEKCQQLVFEYPASPHAAKAKQLQPAIQGELQKGGKSTTAPAGGAAKPGPAPTTAPSLTPTE